jgi:hypothetical protein
MWRALVAVAAFAAMASAHSIDTSPKQAAILRRSDAMLVRSAPYALSLYDLAGGERHRFEVDGWLKRFALSSDERFVALAAASGEIRVFRIDDGTLISEGDVDCYVEALAFSGDDQRLAVGCYQHFAAVLRTRDGTLVRRWSVGDGERSARGVALDRGGDHGVALDDFGAVYRFDTSGDRVWFHPLADVDLRLKTRETERDHLLFAADDRHIVFTVRGGPGGDRVVVVPVDSGPEVKTVIGGRTQWLRVEPDGRVFILSVEDAREHGRRLDPERGTVDELWTSPVTHATDVDPVRMIAVTTDYRFRTKLVDLRTGKTIREIDHSAAYVESDPADLDLFLSAALALAMFGIGLGVYCFVRPRRVTPPSAAG